MSPGDTPLRTIPWRSWRTFLSTLTATLLLCASGCHGNDQSANHLLLFDTLPDGISSHKAAPFDVRTNFSGTVHLVESRDFRAVVNITAPSLQEAYDIKADLFTHRGRLVLEVKENHVINGMLSYTWLLIGMACVTLCVGVCTTIYVVRWYEQERQPYELIDHRSYASSSQRGGVYRPSNSIPMANLAAGGPGGAGREFGVPPGRGVGAGEDGNLRCEEELRQVQEMPEEEEAEAREMEKHHKLKMMKKEKEALATAADGTSGDAALDNDDLHERNLIMSRVNSQAKTLHKDLLSANKKTSSPAPASPGITVGGRGGGGVGSLGRRLLATRRTQDGTYEGVPAADPDDPVDSKEKSAIEDVSDDESESLSSSSRRGGSGRQLASPPPNYAAATASDTSRPFEKGPRVGPDLRVKLGPVKDVKFTTFGGGGSSKSEEPKYANDPSENDPLLILADVHKTPEEKSKSGGKDTRPGNVYVNPSHMKRTAPPPPLPKLSTFGPPKTTSTPKSRVGVSPNGAGEANQDPWVLNSMSDIAEDPREDDNSVVSGSGRSGKSNSMYGSSEIFDSGEYRAMGQGGLADFYDSLLDSDVEVPPLDAEDGGLLSDGGLPSPLGFPSIRGGDKGKVNDDIKLIPGALKSPGAHVGHQVRPPTKPRPHSSFIYRPSLPMSPVTPKTTTKTESLSSDAPTSAAAAPDSTAEESPPLPPLPPYPVVGGAIASIDDESQSASSTAEGSVFQFPPPPSLCQQDSSSGKGRKVGVEYVQIKNPKTKGSQADQSGPTTQAAGRGRGEGGRGGRKLFGAGTYMNVAILSAMCLLTVVGGVYSSFLGQSDQTRVDVTIFAPKQFLGNTTRVFLNYHMDTEVVDTVTDSRLRMFDVEKPLIDLNTKRDACANQSCEHACDEATGLCACLKGYKELDETRCVDVNECREHKVRCDPAAGCHNRRGSYNCICGEDYYGNGKNCRECGRPCPEKHYEVQPCAKDVQKICKACTQTCRPGYFMAQPCTRTENAICRVCRPKCGQSEFESRQCSTHHDRECLNVTVLQRPVTSDNLILEERGHVTDSVTRLDKLLAKYVGFSNYRLQRGTGIYLHLIVRFIDAAQQFVPVNDTRPLNSDPDVVAPNILNSYSVQRLCPYPLPDYYTLRYDKRENITYKQYENGTIGSCEISSAGNVGGTSYHKSQSDSFSCSQPGGLTDIFQMDENFFMARSKWVDTSRRCQRKSLDCEQCIRSCGTELKDHNPICEVDGHRDNGISPKLWLCYNCCVRKKCETTCKDYHMNKCQPQQCTKGNLLKFSLEPMWVSSQDGRFFCHIKPRPKQYLLNLDYTIRVTRRSQEEEEQKKGKRRGQGRGRNRVRGRERSSQEEDLVIHNSKITITGDEDWVKSGAMTYSDGILNIAINSSLGVPPDFLEGDIHPQSNFFKVGDYRSKGSRLGNSYIQAPYVFLRPPNPYGTPAMPQDQQECSVPKLDDMLFTSNMENPYIRRSELEAHADNKSLPFTIKSKSSAPLVMATVSRTTAILRRLYSPVRLREESFRGDVIHNGSHWVVEVTGEVDSCPGYIHIQLSDPARASAALFNCDVAVLCPKTFNLTFAMMTSDLEGMYKDVLIQVKDSRHKHNFRLFRRTSLGERQEEEDIAKELTALNSKPAFDPSAEAIRQHEPNSDDSGSQNLSSETPNLPLPMYALLIIAGGILLLIVLAIIGQCFLADFPIPDTPYAQVHHALFAVCYMVLQFVYSLFISGTAFFLILTIITHRDVTFIIRHGQPGAVSTAASNIELLRLQRHLEGEITRQDALADAAQEMCIHDVEKISRDMKRLHDALLNATQDVFEKHRLDLLLTKQKVHVRQKLSKDLRKFRDSYTNAARAVLKQVNQNAEASYQNIAQGNVWLDGARYLYGSVKLYRNLHRMPVKSFMEWTGIRAELDKLEIDLTFSLPALPRLDDIPAPPPQRQPVKRDAGAELPDLQPIRSIQMHNNWFFPVEEMGIGGAASFISIDHETMERASTAQSTTSAAFFVFLVLLACCDLVLLGHRMCRAWTTAKLCVYGFPEYFRENKEAEMGNDDVFASRESKLTPAQGCRESPVYQSVALFLTQTISTTFFPKISGAIATCVVMVCVLQLSNQYFTVQELERAGLYHSAEQYVDLQTSLTNARLSGHAAHINTLHFPAFQASVSGHLSRHQTVLAAYREQLLGLQKLSTQVYCQHLTEIDLETNCDNIPDQGVDMEADAWHKMATLVHACKFYPVVPRLYVRSDDQQSPTSAVHIEAVLESVRNIIFLTARLVTIFLVSVVLKELLSAVVWIFLQRSGAMRIRVIVERDQDEGLQ